MYYTKNRYKKTEELKFSIVIPSWNNLALLRCCVESIRKNSTFRHQIIVHVNSGSDGTLEWVKSQPDIDYSHTPDNVGVCYALNLARTLVDTDYILYLNDDMYVCPEWDAAFDKAIKSINHHFFFLSGTLIEPHRYLQNSIEKNFGETLEAFKEQQLLSEYGTLKRANCLGALYPPNIVHRDVWDLVGGYSIEFSPGMGSDPDFVAKLWMMGVRHFRILGDCLVYHFGKATTSRIKHNNVSATFIYKWSHTPRTYREVVLRFGLPDTPENIARPYYMPLRKTVKDNLKKWLYAWRYLFSKNKIA
ncbi:MAG: glycosyltransferase [Prevotellaceae bacterium]|jgi:glycosyltransferase involved in cell wall biosynthesis|nr:glycosyltransferase [Prevotellaceae bacterium]